MRQVPHIRLSTRYIFEFLRDGRTPMRAISDEAVDLYARSLAESVDEIIELGSAGDYYKIRLADIIPVRTSNIAEGYDLRLDMTALDLATNSVGAIMSFYAIEHVFDYGAAFDEANRVLRVDGYYLMIAPFIYYYHAAPDDYFRFTASALRELAIKHKFEISDLRPIGDRSLMFTEFLHEKPIMGSAKSALVRFLLRLLAMPFLVYSVLKSRHDDRFPMGYVCLLRKCAGQ